MRPARPVLSWLHFGDLHITAAGEPNHADFLVLIDLANRHLGEKIDFAVLPGDNADQGTAAQFRLVRDGLDRLSLPVHILPGDHDFESRRLDAFHTVLGAPELPYAIAASGCRCLFLDVVSAGTGGPDFRLDTKTLDWLATELRHAGENPVVFMHCYPADLRAGAERLAGLLRDHRVVAVDMGHTHYNELANDGRTIFMATRSTGQIEEGPPGFSLAAVDRGVVSWRFQPLAAGWPLVLVTSPADHRLIIDPASPDQVVPGRPRIGAKIFGDRMIAAVVARIGDAAPFPLTPHGDDAAYWHAAAPQDLPDGLHRLTVLATDAAGATGEETITFVVGRDGSHQVPERVADGSDRDAIGAWPEKHIFGTQLGPNRFGRKW